MEIDWRDYVVCDPGILCGKPTLKGTRLSVEFVLELLSAGFTRKEIDRDYPTLSEVGVKAALAYGAELVRVTGGRNLADASDDGDLPRFEVRIPKNVQPNSLPEFGFILHLMAHFEAINSAIRWHVLIRDNSRRGVVGDLDSFVATFAAIAWTHEALRLLRRDARRVFDKSALKSRPEASAFWDRVFADPPDPMIERIKNVREHYFGHFDPRVIKRFVDYQDANGKPTPFIRGDASCNSKGCRYPWPVEACIFDLLGGPSEGSYSDRTDAVFRDFKTELRGAIGLLVALIDIWCERNNLKKTDAWEIVRLA